MSKSRRTPRSTALRSLSNKVRRFSSAVLTWVNLPSPAFVCALCVRSGDPLDRAAFFPPLNFKEVQYLRKWLASLLHFGLISLECLSENCPDEVKIFTAEAEYLEIAVILSCIK